MATARGCPSPVTVALVDDHDVVLMGLPRMFDQYRDRVADVEMDASELVADPLDLALYDSSPSRNQMVRNSAPSLPAHKRTELSYTRGASTEGWFGRRFGAE